MGYFLKMASSDIFIFHDAVTLNVKGYTRRTYIRDKQSDDPKRLSVSLSSVSQNTLITDVKDSDQVDWKSSHLAQINQNYDDSPYFDQVYPWFESIYLEYADQSLSRFNQYMILHLCQYLEIECQVFLSSELEMTGHTTTEKHISMIQQVGGVRYLSGVGGRAYQSNKEYHHAGLQLDYIESYNLLSQKVGDQRARLSIIDYIFDYSQSELISLVKDLIHA